MPNSRHIAVLYEGYFYVFDVIDGNGHRLTAVEIEKYVRAYDDVLSMRLDDECFAGNWH